MQEYLNRSDALWGIVTNGRELRLLRNSARSSRPSYVAVDLEAILDGNLYNEFALVYRLLHRSRLPPDSGDAHDCLLERWYQQGIEEGGRVRDGLARRRQGGAGNSWAPASCAIPQTAHCAHKLDGDGLTEIQLYRELLNLIYRLLFLMVAEERKLLFCRRPMPRRGMMFICAGTASGGCATAPSGGPAKMLTAISGKG